MKSIVYIGTSLDGFIARKDSDIDWLVQFANDEAILVYEEFINRVDAIVIGRGTFEKVLRWVLPLFRKLTTTLVRAAEWSDQRPNIFKPKLHFFNFRQHLFSSAVNCSCICCSQ